MIFRDQFLSTGGYIFCSHLYGLVAWTLLDPLQVLMATGRPGETRRKNDKTGLSSNLTLLDELYLETVLAPGKALKRVSGPGVWAVWRVFYMRTRKYPREGPSRRLDPCF